MKTHKKLASLLGLVATAAILVAAIAPDTG